MTVPFVTRWPLFSIPADVNVHAACVVSAIAARDFGSCLVFNARLGARVRAFDARGGPSHSALPETLAEIAVLESRAESSRTRRLLATRLVDAALLECGEVRAARLARAAAIFASLGEDAARTRFAYVAEARGDAAASLAAHRALVCPDEPAPPSWAQSHDASYWEHWADTHRDPRSLVDAASRARLARSPRR